MLFTETKLKGAFVIDIERREDSRGFFARAFCQQEFAAHGLKPTIAQANIAFNSKKGRCVACIFNFRRRRRRSSCAHPRRNPGYHCGLAPGKPDLPAARRRRIERGQLPRALRAGALRARIPSVAGQNRNQLSGGRILHARSRGRACCMTIPRLGLKWPLPVTVISEKDQALEEARRNRTKISGG